MALRRLFATLAALALATVAATPAAASTTDPGHSPGASEPGGGIGLRLIDAPAAASDDPRARLYIVDHLAPGTTIKRRIEVTNTSDSAAQVALYAAAATVEDGSFVGADNKTPNYLSTWTSVLPTAPTVLADGKAIATVTIAVPADASPGEKYGVVWAEVRSNPGTGGVTQVSRVGIRLYVSVGPGGPPDADFTIDSITAKRTSDGKPAVLATVHNTGGRALDMNGTLELSDGPGGLSTGPFPATLGTTLAIGTTGPVTVFLDEALPAGPWDAVITLHSGLLDRDAKATITFPDSGTAAAVPATSGWPGWLFAVAGGTVVLLLAFGATFLKLRRSRAQRHRSGLPRRTGAHVR
ncbi:hypothetical protein [Pengzhenrongella sp.]|jgi:hypothetical protein|uniref:hypothetical protein n=1 Tax=Pengzhenrongella sp. TaxID=2888820 RepID=UPI002F936CAF